MKHLIFIKFRSVKIAVMTICLFGIFFGISGMRVKADEPLIIVIDPGHGGENLGGEYGQYREKDLTPIVAEAMKEELEKYEGVEVYLTHDSDVDMSIKDRAAFAGEKNADFLFCLHFNMSVNHNLFGAEVWVPATDTYYSKGYSFAQIQMQHFEDLGLYLRGIKTRLNDRDENYYGILRYCTQEGVPAVLIEHCHLDHPKDQPFYQEGETQWKELGIMDATAVAKYFRLKSEILNVDYSDYPVQEIPVPVDIVRPDDTEPELSSIEVTNVNEETREVTVMVSAEDPDNYILYYEYSIDGGNGYSEFMEWPRTTWNSSLKTNTFTITVPYDQPVDLRVKVYNGFDLFTESNIISLEAIPDPERLKREAELAAQEERRRQQELADLSEAPLYDGSEEEGLDKIRQEMKEFPVEERLEQEQESDSVWYVLVLLILILAAMIFVAFFMERKIDLLLKDKKRR